MWGASQRAAPPIFYTPCLIFYVPHLKFYVPPPKFYIPHLIFYVPPQIFNVNLTSDAVDTLLAQPLPPGVVNCGVELNLNPLPCEDLEGCIEY